MDPNTPCASTHLHCAMETTSHESSLVNVSEKDKFRLERFCPSNARLRRNNGESRAMTMRGMIVYANYPRNRYAGRSQRAITRCSRRRTVSSWLFGIGSKAPPYGGRSNALTVGRVVPIPLLPTMFIYRSRGQPNGSRIENRRN
jgi:hypothetical protein